MNAPAPAIERKTQFEKIKYPPTATDLARNAAVEKFIRKYTRRSGKKKTAYDSIVIAGGGIGALALAARLSRSEEFAGKVTLVAPEDIENRRLVNGVSLRGYGADFICNALECTHADLLDAITGDSLIRPVATRQTAGMVHKDMHGKWQFRMTQSWQGGKYGSDRPIVYGARNARVTGGMLELMQGLHFARVFEKPESLTQLRAFALGSNPLIINVTPNSGVIDGPSVKPNRLVYAAQLPMKVGANGLKNPLDSSTAYAPLIRRNGAVNVGYITPFADPLSPEATWYSISVLPEKVGKIKDKESELNIVADQAIGVGEALGLEPVDPEETLFKATAPGFPHFGKPPIDLPGTFDLKNAYNAGLPAYYADGMTTSAMGGLVAAEAILNGDDPGRAVRKSIRNIKFYNLIWWLETKRIPIVVDYLMRIHVKTAMSWPHTASTRVWTSHA